MSIVSAVFKRAKQLSKIFCIYYLFIYLFTADNVWYRAVVLEVHESEVKVIYADYGNSEMVPFSRILPIPKHLLLIPFQITRCTLSGKKNKVFHTWLQVVFCWTVQIHVNKSLVPLSF